MSQVPLQHHVYSSAGGYRTTFASAELEPEAVRRLESFATAAQGAFNLGRSQACFSFDDDRIVISCTFVHGADHVGRRRLCTHSIVLPASMREHQAFNPAAPRSELFMTTELPVERPGSYLARQLQLPDEGPELDELRRQALVELDDHNQMILAGLFTPARTLVVAGNPSESIRRLGSTAWLLPREVRCNVFYRTGTWAPADARAFGPLAAIVVTKPSRLADYPVGEYVLVDLFAEPQPGPSHPLVRLLRDMHSGLDGQRRLKTLLDVLAAYPGPEQPTLDQQGSLARGYQLAEPLFRAAEVTAAAASHAPGIIKAVFALARSGRQRLSSRLLRILEDALPKTERAVLKEALGALEAELHERFQVHHGEAFGQKLQAYHRRLREAATAQRSPR